MKSIHDHEGRKYLRTIYPADGVGSPIQVDIYQVLVAFGVTCQATGHCIKKLLCAGTRGKGDRLADLIGADAALSRAIDLERQDIELRKVTNEPDAHKPEVEPTPTDYELCNPVDDPSWRSGES